MISNGVHAPWRRGREVLDDYDCVLSEELADDLVNELWSTFPAGSVLALTLKDGNPDDHDVSDVEAMVAARSDTTVVVHRRFRHRLSMAGDELYYVVLAATKSSPR